MAGMFKPLFCAATLSAVAGYANAQSLTGNVGSASITEGGLSAEFRIGAEEDGAAQSRVHVEQALTGWYQVRAIAAFRKPEGEDWDYSGLTVENWLQWSEEGEKGEGFNGGVRLAYTFSDSGAPDVAALRLTLTDRFLGDWEWRANVIAGFETGDQRADGAELESRVQLTRGLPFQLFGARKTRFGAELFSEYGNSEDLLTFSEQAHQAGPVFKAEWESGVFLQAGARAGLTDGADEFMAKIFIGREL